MEKAIDSTTKLVYLCNPNNPTATIVDTKELKAFIARVSPKVPVFVDEAYIDYVKDPQSVTVIDCIKQGMNVIVLRTFSKLYGFAGLRIGYMVAQPAMLTALNKLTEGGMSISGLSMKAALASYQDREFMDDALAKTFASKAFLYETLKKEGYEYIPSDANFVLFPIKMDGRKFAQEMGKRGVSLRSWQFSGKDWCRVSIGTMAEMKAFAAAFTEIA
jgi:histidinol-phosphate aminotransferase